MLHADSDDAFVWACGNGHQEIAEWLWAICPDEEKTAMLHAQDDAAFIMACQEGHQKIAKWLRGLCHTAEERIDMLHACDFDGLSDFYGLRCF